MSPWTISLQSIADLTLGLLHNPYAPPLNCCASRGPTPLSGVHMVASRIVCVILIPFRLSLISYFMLSLKCFSSVPNYCPDMGIRPLLQFLHLPRAGPITLTLFFTPYFLYPSKFCMVLFQLSGTPTCCQFMFCKLFCV